MQSVTFRAMGSQVLAAVDASTQEATDALNRVPEWFEHWEQHLSRFRPNSELSRLNGASGRATHVSHTLWEVAQASLRAARASHGLVSPTVLAALEAAGYDRMFHQIAEGEQPARDPVPVAPSGWKSIQCDAARRAIRLGCGLRLDLGGVAKGWAADRAAQRLGARGPALVDAGGDIAVTAPPADQPGWPIGVADPTSADGQVALLCLERGGVATSGRDYRRWQRNGRWQHHLIDPRTGRPAKTDVLSATVVGPSAEAAEVAAKVALILGSREGLVWLEERPDLAGLVVREDGRVLFSRRMLAYTWS